MRVERSLSKRAICSICYKYIEDEFRAFDFGSRDTLFYHIECLMKAIDRLKDCKNLAMCIDNSCYRGINLREL